MTSSLARAAVVSAFLAISACAAVPPDAVKLSSTEGRDVLALKRSHDFYVNEYYDQLEADANRIIDTQYTPALISAALNGKSGALLMRQLQAGQAGGATASSAIQLMERFVADVERDVAVERQKFITPIELARHRALANIDAAYSNVDAANATITAYLDSLDKLHQADDEVLANLGLPNLQDQAASEISGLSNGIGAMATKSQSDLQTLQSVKSKLKDIEKAVAAYR